MDRFDIYKGIHKAVRHQLAGVIVTLSTTDWADPTRAAAALDAVDVALAAQAEHAQHEENLYHPLLESRVPGAAERASARHQELERQIDTLEKTTAQCRSATEVTEATGYELYLAFCRFVADYFLHLDEEEADIKPLFWENFTDAELLDLNSRVVASVPPESMQVIVPHFLAGLNRSDLIAWLAGMREEAPAEAFAGVQAAAAQIVDAHTWKQVSEALGIAP